MDSPVHSLPCLRLEAGLGIGYREVIATAPTSIELGGGTHFLLARNGRGKTTLLRTLAGSIPKVSGDFQRAGAIQYLPEDLRFDPEITPAMIFRSMIQKSKITQAFDLAQRIELDVKKPYQRLSTGNRRKTSLIMAEFSIRPRQANILLLDEPFSGLDAFARQVFEEIWSTSGSDVLRLVSCHPDYDSMQIASALLIEGKHIRHLDTNGQTWSGLKNLLN